MTNYRYLYFVIFLFGILTYCFGLSQHTQAKQNRDIISSSFHSQAVNKARFTLSDETKGRMFLSSEDDFTNALSEFDLQARMKSLEKVSKAEYLKFAGAAARNWTPDEIQKMMKAASKLQAELEQFPISLPDEILIIKTSGAEEGNGAYTRRNAVILPEDSVKKINEVQLEALLTH